MEDKIRYKEILFPSKTPFSNYVVNESKALAPVSLVNIFIGSNNCGKSRLLRAFFSCQEFKYNTNFYNYKDFYSLLAELNIEYKSCFHSNVSEIGNLNLYNVDKIIPTEFNPENSYIDVKNPVYTKISEILETLSLANSSSVTVGNIRYASNAPQFTNTIIDDIKNISSKFQEKLARLKTDKNLGDEKRYYIPILRGIRPLDIEDHHKNFYGDRTKWDYFKSGDLLTDKMQIFTGLELYQTLKEKLLGEPDERKQVKEFEEFLSENFFENKEVTLIPREKEPKVVHIKIGDESQFPIYDLGDGLQNLIICTFNIFMEKERCLFFMEEPDMFMHPSMQRAFLEVLSKVDRHQYFITSHSNHFLDMTIDFANISVFHFSKHEDNQTQFHIRPSSPHDRQILLDLGVRNSSVFISNATIWVEGITDRLYLKAYMKKYIDELKHSDPEKHRELIKLKEDYHYSFVEYQGANLTHWNFNPDEDDTYNMKASYICAQAFLIADGDIGSEIKGNRKAIYEEMLGNRFLALQVKEIENLIPAEILRQVVAKQFKKYGVNTDLIKYEDYARLDTPIGKYLDDLLPLSKNSLFAAESGTFTSYYKGTVCDNAVKFMQNPESEWSLTDDLKSICEEIFVHIITQNKNS